MVASGIAGALWGISAALGSHITDNAALGSTYLLRWDVDVLTGAAKEIAASVSDRAQGVAAHTIHIRISASRMHRSAPRGPSSVSKLFTLNPPAARSTLCRTGRLRIDRTIQDPQKARRLVTAVATLAARAPKKLTVT